MKNLIKLTIILLISISCKKEEPKPNEPQLITLYTYGVSKSGWGDLNVYYNSWLIYDSTSTITNLKPQMKTNDTIKLIHNGVDNVFRDYSVTLKLNNEVFWHVDRYANNSNPQTEIFILE